MHTAMKSTQISSSVASAAAQRGMRHSRMRSRDRRPTSGLKTIASSAETRT